ncbi:MAG: carboxypeptidase-like regulatory domain-containing protein, partial [Acidobacteriota bacterium]|nr:carboxypeptidase-like regulatory domain-containing protein [Acidobacteriota bacterium]
MRKTNLILGLVLVALIWATPSVYGQSRTGSIAGTVQDSTGAVLPGAEITVTNVDTGQSRGLVTGDAGEYNALALDLGTYEVRAELQGFQTAVRRGLTVGLGQEALVDLTLAVGEISEEVIVTGEAPLINTT